MTTPKTTPETPRFQHTFCQACGKDCGPGDDGPIDCQGHGQVSDKAPTFEEINDECRRRFGIRHWHQSERDRVEADLKKQPASKLVVELPELEMVNRQTQEVRRVPAPQEEDVEGHLLYEVRCDAARWRALPAFIEKYQIDYVGLLTDIDAMIAGHSCEPDLCQTPSECDSLGCRSEREAITRKDG